MSQTLTLALPALPYAEDALAPHISVKTLQFHYGKHHKAYVDKTNELVADSKFADMPLEKIIEAAATDSEKAVLFNNAAQVWNHSFYWRCMKPQGGGRPSGDIAKQIDQDFGSYESFAEQFKLAAAGQFGSGWAWLVSDKGKLAIVKTSNADLPLVRKQIPLLTIDVWEHAYYLDYQNRRPDYVTTFLGHLVNWDFVNQNLAKL